MQKKALISVFDKSNLELLLSFLKTLDYQIISTGGTAKHIRELGYQVVEVNEITQFPEMLGGRIKTLHPKILGGILARKEESTDMEELRCKEIETIDLVVVNLYPFESIIKQENLVFEDAIENIDIGGPTLLRSAAKNYKSITVLSNPNQYALLIDIATKYSIDSQEHLALRERFAIEAFDKVSRYDSIIHNFLKNQLERSPLGASYKMSSVDFDSPMPQSIQLNLKLLKSLRYGENPHQQAGLYVDEAMNHGPLVNFEFLQGKELSFNNLLDIQSAWNIVTEYNSSIPCCAIIKHNNPCGVAIAPNAALAFSEAFLADTVSAFGGIVAFNTELDGIAALEMKEIFLECIIAPAISHEARNILSHKKNLRLIQADLPKANKQSYDIKNFDGAFLVQSSDDLLLEKEKLKVVSKRQIEEHQWVDLIFAWKIVKHMKSNAVVVVKNGKTVGIGCGQTNRVQSVEAALSKIDLDTRSAVLASDGFLPFADSVNLSAQNHISVIIQPGGSIRDQEVIEACDSLNIAMVFTGIRHFKH